MRKEKLRNKVSYTLMYLYKKMKLMKPIIIIRKSQIVNRKLSSLQNRSAFTLIELLISVSLATILILVTAMIFKQASSAFSESDARNEVYQNVRAAFDTIKKDISGAKLNIKG